MKNNSPCAPLCCKNACCTSCFFTGGCGGCGQQMQGSVQGPVKQNASPGNSLRFRDKGRGWGRSSTRDQKTRTRESKRHINLRKLSGQRPGAPRPGVPGTPDHAGVFQKVYVIFSRVPFLLPQDSQRKLNQPRRFSP